MKKNTEALLYDSKEVSLEVSAEKTKDVYVLVQSPECRKNHKKYN
jgi:hypothetical protein